LSSLHSILCDALRRGVDFSSFGAELESTSTQHHDRDFLVLSELQMRGEQIFPAVGATAMANGPAVASL